MVQEEDKKIIYDVIIPKSAQKELNKISNIYYDKIADKINSLENNPRPTGSLKLSDSEEYRIRVGVYSFYMTLMTKPKPSNYFRLSIGKMHIRRNKIYVKRNY